jgi:hypothetical protein
VPDLTVLVVGLALVGLALFVAVALLLRRVVRLEGRLDDLTRGADGNLANVLGTHLERVADVGRRQDALEVLATGLETATRRAVQGVGLVRFNTFEDTGGNQSFAVALLDPAGNGVVLTSLHARSGTRVYAKGVARGAAEGALSAEEAEALRLAGTRAAGR